VRSDHDVIVVGLGGIGSAAAYWLARRGVDVLGLERFELGHDRGASHDHSRIIRLSYHTTSYVRLAREAYDAWTRVEEDAGARLIVRTGGLDLGPGDGAIPLQDYEESMDACGVPFERMDAGEVMRRWPQWRLDDGVRALFQPDAGLVSPSRSTALHQDLATAHGATLRDRTPVLEIRDRGTEVTIVTEGGTYGCRAVAIAVDAWTNDLLAHLGLRLPLTITQEQVTYLAARSPDSFAPDRFPVWIWMDVPCFYGLPAYGEPGPKVAQDVGGREVTPATRTFEPDVEVLGRVRRFVERHLPDALGPAIATRTCLYTLTPDRDFVIDALPGHPSIFLALGAAHGFKFASLIGRILADLTVDGHTDVDIERFAFGRSVLTMPDPPKTFFT
jgi:sarcosine oxidase